MLSSMSTPVRVGSTLFIQYQGQALYHERLVLGVVAGLPNQVIIVTPDDDVYLEDLSITNQDITDVKICRSRGVLPRGIAGGNAYRFREYPDPGAFRELVREAAEEAATEAFRRGTIVATEPSGAWLSTETVGSVRVGDVVSLHEDALVTGDKAIHLIDDQGERRGVFCIYVDAPKVEEKQRELRNETGDDARVLPVQRVNGVRHRPFKEAVDRMEQVEFPDWKVGGPRSAMWCLRFLAARGGPLSHHEWWKSVLKLTAADPGVTEHESCMRTVADACEFDQLDASNGSALEHIRRKAQLWEYHYKEKMRVEAASSKDRPIVDSEEQQAFLGTTTSDSSLMICPALTEWVAKELQRSAEIEKQARKAREERALRRGR